MTAQRQTDRAAIIARLTVEPVTGGGQASEFVELPYRLYRTDPNWVPPLRRDENRRWSPKHDASLRSRWVRQFLARRGGQVVGRIAAIVDRPFASRWEPSTGMFGFFECTDDRETAQGLLAACEDALSSQGMTRVIGPINLTTHDETGVLIDGFDSPPMVLSPYNPPYYARLLEQCGYLPSLDYYSYFATPSQAAGPALLRIARSADSGRGIAGGITIRSPNLRNWDAEVRTFWELYNASFEKVWGFVPITWDEFRERADRFRPVIVPDLAPIAEMGGKPVGFALTLPDINAALAHVNGRLWPFGWLRLAREVPRLRTARFFLLGVRPGYTGRGIGAVLALKIQAAARRIGVQGLELSLVQASNARVRRIVEAFGCKIGKTYRLYARPLPDQDASETVGGERR